MVAAEWRSATGQTSGNSAQYGAAIFNNGSAGTATLTVNRSTLSGNSAAQSAGGIYNDAQSGNAGMSITNSTLSGNSATSAGGAIVNDGQSGSATVVVRSNTFSGNSAPNGGGIYNQSGSVTMGNTILKKGAIGVNIFNGNLFTSSGYNLSNDNGGGLLTGTGDQINTDPILGPLQNNGGPTFTHAPLSNSPAIDRGKDIGGTGQDQRGSLRPVTYDLAITPPAGGDRSDIGAVELPPGVQPTSAVSRKTHGVAGPFDINLSLSGVPGIESRSGGATNDYQIVLTFATPVTYANAAVTNGAGSVSSSSGSGTTTITLNLTGVTTQQTITLALFNVNDGTNSGDVGLRMSVLVGDVNASGSVGAADIALTKAQSGVPVNGSNFREDVTTNGSIGAADIVLVKSKSGNVLPPP